MDCDKVTFSVDSNGILEVSAMDVLSRKVRSMPLFNIGIFNMECY